MTAAVAQILNEVQQLTPREQVELRRRIVKSIPMSDDLTDDDFTALAAESFRLLDDEEAQRADHEQLMADLKASAGDEAAGRLRDAEVVMAEMAAKFGLTN